MNDFIKLRKNDIYLSDSDIKVLEKYEINYLNYNNMQELLFDLEEILNNNYVDNDLEELSIKLAEYNYYFRTNK
ncbi:MAG: hypothetical protein ACI4WF_00015 [Bacilli bacterium]